MVSGLHFAVVFVNRNKQETKALVWKMRNPDGNLTRGVDFPKTLDIISEPNWRRIHSKTLKGDEVTDWFLSGIVCLVPGKVFAFKSKQGSLATEGWVHRRTGYGWFKAG